MGTFYGEGRRVSINQNLRSLEKQVGLLREKRDLLNSALNSHDQQLFNSMPLFMAGAFGNTGPEIASTAQLGYYNAYAPLTLQYQYLMYAYKSQPVLQTIIDMPTQDALRGGLEFGEGEVDKDDIKMLEDKLRDMSFYQTVKTGENWAQLFGGAAYIINTDEDPATEFNPKRLYGKRLKIYSASRWELQSSSRWSQYYIFYGERIHGSRVFTIQGKEAPFQIRWTIQDWGLSKYEAMLEPFNIYLRTQQAIYDLMKEAKVDVYKFKGWLSQLASSAGTALALKRVQLSNQAKSTGNAVVMDAEDEYLQKQITFAGLADIWKENRLNLAQAARIPMNKLFGISASGFSTGEDDLENYISMIDSEVREHLRPTLQYLLDLVQMNLFGQDMGIAWDFKPLRVMSSEQEENIKKSKHDRWYQDMQAGILNPQEYAQLCQKDGLITIETAVAKGAMPEPMMGLGDEDEPDQEEKPKKKKEEK